MDRLGQLQTLVAIVDTGSLVGAARQVGRSPPSISRDLAELERRIGACLVARSTRTCRPTPVGRQLAEDARKLLGGFEEAIGQASGETISPRGLVRVTAPITFGSIFVAPLLVAFLDNHAEVAIDLHLVDRVVDLVEEDFDLAVRIGHLPDSALVVRVLGEFQRVTVASPTYLQLRGTPRCPEDLINHDIVRHAESASSLPVRAVAPKGRPMVPSLTRFTVNQPEVAVAAARNGRGITTALSYQVDADLKAGRLIRLLRDFEPEAIPLNLVFPESRRNWRRIRLLIDHLTIGVRALGESAFP